MNVLMLSSSRYLNFPYLAYAQQWIDDTLQNVSEVLFIPYAGVTVSWDAYTQMVQDALPNVKVTGIHQFNYPEQALDKAQAILVGGGNTFNLLNMLYQHDLLAQIQQKVQQHTPYIGWSAGANICGATIKTTNDMPIVQPPSFTALQFVNAQINPHYNDYVAPNHHGETRDQRIAEYCTLNPSSPVIAIREGCALRIESNRLTLQGDNNAFVFFGEEKTNVLPLADLSEYL